MEIRKSKYGFIVGGFIVVALAIFITTIFTIGGQQTSFSKKIYVKAKFDEINGLKEGNNVWFHGYKIGTVKSIALKDPYVIDVTLSIEKNSHQFIKHNAYAKIGSDGFLGNKIVIIYGGSDNMPGIENNGYLQVKKDTITNEDMLATLQSSNKNLLDITNRVKSILEQVNDGKGIAGRFINDSSLANNLQFAIRDFRLLALKGKQSAANIEDLTARANTKSSSINKFFADSLLYDTLKSAISELKSIMQKAGSFADNMNLISQNLVNASNNLSDTTNPAGMLLNRKETAADIESSIRSVKEAGKKLNDDLEAIQHNFLFRSYFKRKAKTK
jgi:phospholipid/cholesterol/gamma-HCH transport system substrate-binding protein